MLLRMFGIPAIIGEVVKTLTQYIATTLTLSATRSAMKSANVGVYGLVTGGVNGSAVTITEAWDNTLTKTTPTALGTAKQRHAATSIGNYALEGGGFVSSSTTPSSVVEAYDDVLTKSIPTALGTARIYLAGASNANYALLTGGYRTGWGSPSAVTEAYDSSLTKSIPTALGVARSSNMAGSTGEYVLVGGGRTSSTEASTVNNVDAYDAALTKTTPTAFGTARRNGVTGSVGSYLFFIGGTDTAGALLATIEAYDDTTTKVTSPTALPVATTPGCAPTMGGELLVMGGTFGILTYDTDLVQVLTALDYTPARAAIPITIDKYLLFAGALNSGDTTNAVNVYQYE